MTSPSEPPSNFEMEIVADYECWTGEGPVWHPDERCLYWVDIPEGRLYRYDPATGKHECCYERVGSIGGFTIQANGNLLLFMESGRVATWNSADGLNDIVVDTIPKERDSRFNDVIADPQGRVFCGTMPTDDRRGRLYRLDTDGSLSRLFDDVAIPNGMAFSPDRQRFYFAETEIDHIYRFEYDELTGELSNRSVFTVTSDEAGKPDGITIDAAGYVWVAFWNGGCIRRYAPNGTTVECIEFPARKVSSVTFGGPAYLDSYVTTALGPGGGKPGIRDEEGEGAGALFRIDLGMRGVSPFRSRITA